jgi:hypothetical protein
MDNQRSRDEIKCELSCSSSAELIKHNFGVNIDQSSQYDINSGPITPPLLPEESPLKSRERRKSLFRMLLPRVVIGGLVGSILAALSLYILHGSSPSTLRYLSEWICPPSSEGSCDDWLPSTFSIPSLHSFVSPLGTSSFVSKNENATSTSSAGTTAEATNEQRRLATESSSTSRVRDSSLVIAGKLTVEEQPCNIAQFNLKASEWSLTERIQLSLYNSYSGGEVYSLLANHTYTESSGQSSDPKRYVILCRSCIPTRTPIIHTQSN